MLARESPSAAAHGRIVAGAFRPHPLLASPHVQTLLPALLRPMPQLALRIERWERPDGDFVNLGFCGEGDGPRVILLHGLSGGFDSKYLRGFARRILALGWRAVVMEFRGAGPEPNRLPRYYHHGDTADLRDLVLRLREAEPASKLLAVGWSLGGNVLLKYLGEERAATALAGAVAVSVPFSIRDCAEHLRRGFARVYQNKMLWELKRNLRRKADTMPLPINLDRALASKDFFDYDNAVTAPLNGFADAEDYYARVASGQFLTAIQRPTLVIHAKDDPFMTPAIIPAAAQLSPQVTLELCEHGGHVGFVSAASNGLPNYWLEQCIPQFLKTFA